MTPIDTVPAVEADPVVPNDEAPDLEPDPSEPKTTELIALVQRRVPYLLSLRAQRLEEVAELELQIKTLGGQLALAGGK